MRYSQLTRAFYPKSEHYLELPEDVVDVPREDYDAAMNRAPCDTFDLIDGRIVIIPKPAVTLAELKAEKRIEIEAECKAAITRGIDNDALGSMHHYPTSLIDQSNLNGLISKSILLADTGEPYKFWCADVNDVWGRHGHTAAQIQTIGLEVAAHVIAAQDLYETKLTEIDAAATEDALQLITWP
jgi:hypothetical protein